MPGNPELLGVTFTSASGGMRFSFLFVLLVLLARGGVTDRDQPGGDERGPRLHRHPEGRINGRLDQAIAEVHPDMPCDPGPR